MTKTNILVQYSDKFMLSHFLPRSLLLCFCTVLKFVKTIHYNAMHKFVGVLDNP